MTDALRARRDGVIAVTAALALSCLALHGDLSYTAWVAHFAADGQWNVYEAMRTAMPDHVAKVTYHPIVYFYYAAAIRVGRVFGLFSYDPWNVPVVLTVPEALTLRIAFVPALWLLAATTRRLYTRFLQRPDDDPALPHRVFVLTLSSPILLFVTFVFGGFDVLPATAALLGTYWCARGRVVAGVLALVVGAWLKSFPLVPLLLFLPLLVSDHGVRRVGVALAVGAVATAMTLWPFAGPALREGYLAFRHTDYDVLYFTHDNVRLTFTQIALAGLALWSVAWALQEAPPERRWRQFVILYAGSLVALLAPRMWMPQYMAWLVPVPILLILAFLPWRWAFPTLLTVALGAAYFVNTLCFFPGNVDTNMFRGFLRPGDPPLGYLAPFPAVRSLAWSATAILLVAVMALLAWKLLAGPPVSVLRPRPRWEPLTQVRVAIWLSWATLLGYVGAHACHAWLQRWR